MRGILLGTMISAALAVLSFGSASAKTVRECDAEYAANKPAIQGVQRKADFITACRAGTEVIPGSTVSVPTAPAGPLPTTTAAPAPASPPSGGGIFGLGRKKLTPTTGPASVPASPAAPTTAATGVPSTTQCPGSVLVWVNTRSGVYHFPGTHNYGNTKAGAYMCEANATAAGDRASKTEKHP